MFSRDAIAASAADGSFSTHRLTPSHQTVMRCLTAYVQYATTVWCEGVSLCVENNASEVFLRDGVVVEIQGDAILN